MGEILCTIYRSPTSSNCQELGTHTHIQCTCTYIQAYTHTFRTLYTRNTVEPLDILGTEVISEVP